ncbi:MAG: hypothetical protein ACR2MU_02650 [Gaiellaceae bacterium]
MRPILASLLVTVGLAVANALGATNTVRAAEIWLLALGAIGLATLTFSLHEPASSSALERALRPARAPRAPRPQELERLEREITLSVSNAFTRHHRLRPFLRELTEQRLAERGLALVPDTVGAELWDELRPDREPPTDRLARGISLERLESLTARLEEI